MAPHEFTSARPTTTFINSAAALHDQMNSVDDEVQATYRELVVTIHYIPLETPPDIVVAASILR